jgi:outer membrane protein assembly factor BamB
MEGGIIYAASPDGKVLALDPPQRRRGLPFPGDREWVFPTDKDEKGLGIIYARPFPGEDKLFLATFNGKVWVFNRAEGLRPGEEPLFQDESLVATPVLAGGVLVVAAGNRLYAIDADSGAERWPRPFEAENRIWASPVVLRDKVIFGSLDRRLYAVGLSTGEKLWSFEAGGGIASTPLVADSTIYFGSFDGHLYAVGSDGRQVWASPFRVDDWVWSRPIYHEGTVYFGVLDGWFYAVGAGSGRERWSLDAGGPIRAAPVLEDGVLVLATMAGEVFGVNPKSGAMEWRRSLGEGVTVSADLGAYDGEVYVSSGAGRVYALEARTGKRVWSFSLTEAVE